MLYDTTCTQTYSPAVIYYGSGYNARRIATLRKYGSLDDISNIRDNIRMATMKYRVRRHSQDSSSTIPKVFSIPVKSTLKTLLENEDTDSNMQITMFDHGNKVFAVGTARSSGINSYEIRGTYMLSNLLQELTLAQSLDRITIMLDERRLSELPLDRLCRIIRDVFWTALTRQLDGENIIKTSADMKDWTGNVHPRIYIPCTAAYQYTYYTNFAKANPQLGLDIRMLPKVYDDPEFVRNLNDAPGLLALEMEEITNVKTGVKTLRGVPYIVPGGRFNELYGWDSYMASIGLLLNGKVNLVKSIIVNFCFCIEHYGKILNATRSYYLCRSQPPFLTDLILRVYRIIKHEDGALEFLRRATLSAIKEYYSVWMNEPRYEPNSGLSRYRPQGIGIPPETEASHFNELLVPRAEKLGISVPELVKAYNSGVYRDAELDEYLLHDRAVRESGHDTTYRLELICANLATVDLNSLLFKYERDIAYIIREHFNDKLEIPEKYRVINSMLKGNVTPCMEHSSTWDRRAHRRRLLMNRCMWDDEKGIFFDYNTVTKQRHEYVSSTTFWTLWAKVATPRQAHLMVSRVLPRLEARGGLTCGTERSRGKVGLHRPNRQWDYPYGWAPQQMLAWLGLLRYGYEEDAQRLAYKWCFMVLSAFVNFNGAVVEKYDVTQLVDTLSANVEYGNQGSNFRGVAREGFAWVNASFVYGVSFLTVHMRRALGALTPYETFAKATAKFNDKTLRQYT